MREKDVERKLVNAVWESGRTSDDCQWQESRRRWGSERPEIEPVALSQRRTGGSPGQQPKRASSPVGSRED